MVERRAGTEAPPRVARIIAVVRNAALAGLALYFLAQLAYAMQHTDRYLHDVYRVSRYYAFPLLMAVLLTAWGLFALRNTPVDAIPDLSDVQVIIRTSFPGQAIRYRPVSEPSGEVYSDLAKLLVTAERLMLP